MRGCGVGGVVTFFNSSCSWYLLAALIVCSWLSVLVFVAMEAWASYYRKYVFGRRAQILTERRSTQEKLEHENHQLTSGGSYFAAEIAGIRESIHNIEASVGDVALQTGSCDKPLFHVCLLGIEMVVRLK